MPLKPCLDCGALSERSRCPTHRTKSKGGFKGPNAYRRDNTAHKRFARAVLKAAGFQCQWVDPKTGRRCLVVRPLQAHHLEPGNDDPAKGVALCVLHHGQLDSKARRSHGQASHAPQR